MYRDFYDGWKEDIQQQIKGIEQGIADALKLVETNRIVHDRAKDVCVLPPDVALSYGFTGPTLRASGVPYDLRKDSPYYNYDAFDFSVPVGTTGRNNFV